MAKVELKQPIVEEISANIKDAQSVVLVDYLGLSVAEDTQLRKQLREAASPVLTHHRKKILLFHRRSAVGIFL